MPAVQRGPVAEDVLAAVNERATAIFQSHKHKVSGSLEPQQGPYALALVGAMLGLTVKQLGESEFAAAAEEERSRIMSPMLHAWWRAWLLRTCMRRPPCGAIDAQHRRMCAACVCLSVCLCHGISSAVLRTHRMPCVAACPARSTCTVMIHARVVVPALHLMRPCNADEQLQMTQKVGRRALSYEEFMTACEAMVALHGQLAQQQLKRLPSERRRAGEGGVRSVATHSPRSRARAQPAGCECASWRWPRAHLERARTGTHPAAPHKAGDPVGTAW